MWRWRPVGSFFAIVLLVLPALGHFRPAGEGSFGQNRAALVARLEKDAAPQLVFVRYPSADWHPHQEWVYNGAGIDSQKVIFAHDLGEKENRALLAHYPGREASLLMPREDGYTLAHYP
jgi:hypothetical protein